MAILIMGILMTMGIGVLRSTLEHLSLEETRSRLNHFQEIFVHYLRRNQRLPCPDVDDDGNYDGSEDLTGGICTRSSGVLPYAELGLDRHEVMDGWNHFFTYHVSNQTNTAADISVRCPSRHDWTASSVIRESFQGELTVTGSGTVDCAVAVVVSHGPNGDGAHTVDGYRNATVDAGVDELENADDDWTYSSHEFSGNHDDLLVSFSATELMAPLIREGSILAEGVLSSNLEATLTRIQGALFAFAAGRLNDHPGCPALPAWTVDTVYAEGEHVIPPGTKANGYFYEVVVGGTSVEQPTTWPTVVGQIEPEVGGSVQWNTVATVSSRNRHHRHDLPGGATTETSGVDGDVHDPMIGFVPFTTLSLSPSDVTDPWGNPIRYLVDGRCAGDTLVDDGLFFPASCGVSGTAYLLVSGGADGFDASHYSAGISSGCHASDRCVAVTVFELLDRMTSAGISVDTFTGCP
ncbi:MAG: hypothetical protein HQL83_15025 [Magnetococcales bacterium]|nr:hypothetical protein [Magnetococcales bacterium]